MDTDITTADGSHAEHRAPFSNSSASKPELELPPGVVTNRWGRAVWFKKHSSGAVCIGWRLFPLHIYVVGWSSWAGSRVVPKLVEGVSEPDPFLAEHVLYEICEQVFARGPSEAMMEEAQRISANYAKNGKLGGRGKRRDDRERQTTHREGYPGHTFEDGIDGIILMTRHKSAYVKDLCSDWSGKDLRYWSNNGPTQEMVEQLEKIGRTR